MTKKELISSMAIGVLAANFVAFPVFAEGPVDIRIVEMGDDGAGNLISEWQDITGAMPGMTYNAVPRIQNDGTETAAVRMCLTESGMDVRGNVIELDDGTFAIDINDAYWTKDTGNDEGGAVSSPINVCYKYNTKLMTGEVTEPLFSEVSLSSELGNEHKNATFSLHLYAEAVSDESDNPDSLVNPDNSVSPNNPDTGAATNTEFDAALAIPYILGIVAVSVLVIHLLRSLIKRK